MRGARLRRWSPRRATDCDACDYVVVTGGGPASWRQQRGATMWRQEHRPDIKLPFEQIPNPYITPELCFDFRYFGIRKMHFLMRAKALIAFPGGFGTLDELFEALTLIQTEKVPRIPVVLVGRAFWDRIVDFPALVEEGVISPGDLDLVSYAETAEEIWDTINRFYPGEAAAGAQAPAPRPPAAHEREFRSRVPDSQGQRLHDYCLNDRSLPPEP